MRKTPFVLLLGLMMLVLAACGAENETQGSDSGDTNTETITIEHALDEVEVPKNPESVVVFDFGMLDTMDALDIPVAGVPKDSLPSYLEGYAGDEYEHVGGLKEPDFETIHGMDPDLIIISGRQMDLYGEFKDIAPTVYVELDPTNYMESFEHNVKLVGEIFDQEAEVEEKLAEVNEQLVDLQEQAQASDKNGLVVMSNGGKVSAFGPGSRYGLIHDVFGIEPADENVEVAQHGQNISFEYIVSQDPDFLFVIDRDAVVGGEASAQSTIENKLIESTTAYQEDQIIYLDPNYWYLSGGGLISVSEMIQSISETFK